MDRNEELALIEKFIAERGVSPWPYEPPEGTDAPPRGWHAQISAKYRAAAVRGGKKGRGRPRKS